ncbi:hypothetical protein [uncultured Novosphingobium sp.]|uniref:hypothetical protein n=1 Tax=uncultured Novosphingobium sp. TaxID=292277 RepID=UPI00259A45BE|nr:hypothetical protein [uncultured Novosphingobium sp.]
MQVNPPELPPMKAVGENNPAPKMAAPSQAQGAEFRGTRRMRQILTALTSGGLILVVGVGIGEMVLRPGIRPTDILATIEARPDIGVFNQKMGAAPGEMTLTEDQYRAKIAEAERAGQAKAEIVFQRELADVQADKEILVGAYQALYQRTNLIAQAGVQMEAVALQFRQQLLQQTNGGRATVIAVYDMICALGDQPSCDKARQARAGMIQEASELTEGDLAKKVRELMSGIPDPATLMSNTRGNGVRASAR